MALLSEYHKLSEGSENAQNTLVLKGLKILDDPVNVCITAHSIARTKKPNMAAQVVVMGR